jgi:hypothetical protein
MRLILAGPRYTAALQIPQHVVECGQYVPER